MQRPKRDKEGNIMRWSILGSVEVYEKLRCSSIDNHTKAKKIEWFEAPVHWEKEEMELKKEELKSPYKSIRYSANSF